MDIGPLSSSQIKHC